MKSTIRILIILSMLVLYSCKKKEESNNTSTVKDSIQEKSASVNNKKIVTEETYIRAETDREFEVISKAAGGVNKFLWYRDLVPLDKQTVVRMNKDVLYGGAVIDVSKGASIVFPQMPDKRYASILVLDNDHYCPEVIYKPGKYKLPSDTQYMFIAVRIQLFHPEDPAEVKLVNSLQDKFIIEAGSSNPLPEDSWDEKSRDSLSKVYNTEFAKYDRYPDDWMGPRGKVNEKTRKYAAAGAWGLFPNKDATYINYNGGNLSGSKCYTATYKVPENKGFWSITVYGADGYMKDNNNIINAYNVKYNPDKTFTVFFGSKENCPSNVKNRLDVEDGWNFLMRVYLPGKEVLNGSYKLPAVREVK
ncbi:DUF1254 domain-containing protein [Flavobacterium sp. YJ01]|uniref:DUF1254 domain-containing protein n=1 Tax=unclassified Flavobacterium TaxID=196869 RepID=UPI0023E3D4F9|nr:DUF1254 domain-containing protein [Flavobacterium sp. YJ01]WET01806.1 DUF1214 domain-containing protein [Flavobacterium sp. YJ01]